MSHRTESKVLRVAFGFVTAVLLISILCARSSHSQEVRMGLQNPPKVTFQLPEGPMQAKATTACLECHEGRIILQQRLSKATWTKEVDKMTKWGAVVDASDRDALIDYLSTNFGPDQPAYQPPRSAAEKPVARKTK